MSAESAAQRVEQRFAEVLGNRFDSSKPWLRAWHSGQEVGPDSQDVPDEELVGFGRQDDDASVATPDSRSFKLYIGSREGSGPALPDWCESALLLECHRGTLSDGQTQYLSYVAAAVKYPADGNPVFTLIGPEDLSSAKPSELRIERNVRIFWPSGVYTSATETVWAPSTDEPTDAFVSSNEDLEAIADQPDLAESWPSTESHSAP